MFHVSSVLNRDSIATHGLDWMRMGAARGIAGSRRPEADGVFLCRSENEAQFFVRINNTGGAVDVWSVEGVDPARLVESGTGFSYLPERIPPARLSVVQSDLPPSEEWMQRRAPRPTAR